MTEENKDLVFYKTCLQAVFLNSTVLDLMISFFSFAVFWFFIFNKSLLKSNLLFISFNCSLICILLSICLLILNKSYLFSIIQKEQCKIEKISYHLKYLDIIYYLSFIFSIILLVIGYLND